MFEWIFKKQEKKVEPDVCDRELNDDQLDDIAGGGKYDLHGKGYNSGKSSPFKGKDTNNGEF